MKREYVQRYTSSKRNLMQKREQRRKIMCRKALLNGKYPQKKPQ